MARNERIIRPRGVNINQIAGEGVCGWNLNWGEEALSRYLVPEVMRGNKVLDLCSGAGRATIPLAMKGAIVTLVDIDSEALACGIKLYKDASIVSRLEKTIISDAMRLPRELYGGYRFVVAQNAITHMRKPTAIEFIDNLPILLSKKGGFIMVDGPS